MTTTLTSTAARPLGMPQIAENIRKTSDGVFAQLNGLGFVRNPGQQMEFAGHLNHVARVLCGEQPQMGRADMVVARFGQILATAQSKNLAEEVRKLKPELDALDQHELRNALGGAMVALGASATRDRDSVHFPYELQHVVDALSVFTGLAVEKGNPFLVNAQDAMRQAFPNVPMHLTLYFANGQGGEATVAPRRLLEPLTQPLNEAQDAFTEKLHADEWKRRAAYSGRSVEEEKAAAGVAASERERGRLNRQDAQRNPISNFIFGDPY